MSDFWLILKKQIVKCWSAMFQMTIDNSHRRKLLLTEFLFTLRYKISIKKVLIKFLGYTHLDKLFNNINFTVIRS